MIRAEHSRAARKRYREMATVLNERSRRRFVALERRALGRGGVSLMTRISGLARSTIYHGLSDIRDKSSVPAGRVRKEGGGRKKKSIQDPTRVVDLKRLVEPVTRGDPMQPLLWTTRSLRNLANELANKGHTACPTVVRNLLRGMGYSLQANSKTREGGQHIDRDAQFNYINTQAKAFLAANEPVISVDTKKKELVGNFKNNGREGGRNGTPELVNVHDFIDPKLSRAVPYGVYDVTNNVGWVSLGTDHDPAPFACNAIRRWWRTMGKKRHPKAKRLMIAADGGGSNGYRVRLWKVELQKLANELKLPITVCHLPPGTSKWNKMYEGQNAWPLGRLGSGEDDFGQAWDGVSARDGESVAEVVPERDFELGAGFDETEKGIAAITTDIATGAGTDLAPGDVAADVVLRSVGVQWDFGSVEHHQQLGFVGVEPREQAVEGDEAGLALEDAVEPSPQCCLALFGGAATIGLEMTFEVPDQLARVGRGGAILVGEGVQLVNQTLGMNPTQAVLADIELTGVVADDHGVGEEAVRLDAAPQRRLGGDHHGVWIDLEGRDTERFEVGVPGVVTGKAAVGMLDQASDHMGGQRAFAHVGQRLGVNDVIVVAGAQQREEVEAALGAGGAEPGEMRVADLRAEAIRSFVASAGVVHRDPGSTEEPGPQHIAGLIAEAVLAIDQQTHDLTLGDDDPEPAQQRHQTWHRRLPLMILGEHEAAQFRPEVTIDAGRQRRRHHAAIRRLPAFAAGIHNMRTDHQILHHEARVAFEA